MLTDGEFCFPLLKSIYLDSSLSFIISHVVGVRNGRIGDVVSYSMRCVVGSCYHFSETAICLNVIQS